MSLFDSIASNLLQGSGSAHPGLTGELLNMLGGGQGGGLASLVQKFEGSGLGSIAQSWVSRGANLPVTADQVTSVLGSPQIAQLAARFGIAPEHVAAQLSQLLPHVVDALTPNGSLPEADKLQEGLSLLRQHLG